MGRAGTGTGGAAVAVAVAGPLLLMLLAGPPPTAASDSRKSGEPARTRGCHGGGGVGWGPAGWGAAGRRSLDCVWIVTHPGGACALTWRGLRAQVPTPGGGVGGARAAPCGRPVLK